MSVQTNFEAWAKLLISRKVPQNFMHLINPEVIHSGADILKRGESFEVHLEASPAQSTETPAYMASTQGRIFVTPMPHFFRASAN
jgi:hypothetical protein